MKSRKIHTAFAFPLAITLLLGGCGQTGSLYLPDDKRAVQLEQRTKVVSVEEATQLRSEAAKLRQRHKQVQQYQKELAQLETKQKRLLQAGKTVEAAEQLKAVNKVRYKLGQLMLDQQRDAKAQKSPK